MMTGPAPAPAPAEPRPTGWRAINIYLLTGAAFVVVVAGMSAAAGILVPFLLALFVAVICAPLYQGMQRRGLPSALAMLAVVLLVLAAMLLPVGVEFPIVLGFLALVLNYIPMNIALDSSDDTRWIALLMSGRPRRRSRLGAGRRLEPKPGAQTG
jgi:hypothetical protein